ncbi:hypothetical protein [Nocardioides houyundeii]|uniref:hypothetical protein n=1 Tax=Nocardioides houyundeii TaxID=2045452 RepID=UPI0013151119|nr:hypothetical protein [Nocardioides houyundeii]
MTWSPTPTAHPVLGCAATIITAVQSVARVDPAYMRLGDKEQALLDLARARDLVEVLWLRVIDSAAMLPRTPAPRTWPHGWPPTPTSTAVSPPGRNTSPDPWNGTG